MRLLLVENAILFLVGGLAGLGVAWLGIKGLLTLEPAYAAFYDVRLNTLAATVGMALALITGGVFGVAPALEAFRSAPAGALKDGDHRGGTSRGSQRFRSGLVVAQLALSVSLLVGAGLLTRTMSALMGVTPGLRPDRSPHLGVPPSPEQVRRRARAHRVLRRTASGVEGRFRHGGRGLGK